MIRGWKAALLHTLMTGSRRYHRLLRDLVDGDDVSCGTQSRECSRFIAGLYSVPFIVLR